jgi:hypothetical protein
VPLRCFGAIQTECITSGYSTESWGAARCYTWLVPTSRPRHTVTETPRVQEALDELRAVLGRGKIDFAELTILGARAKVRDLRDSGAEARAARERLTREIREGDSGVDVAAADEVKRLGLIASDR